MLLKAYVQQSYIYLINNTEKNSNNVKYDYTFK